MPDKDLNINIKGNSASAEKAISGVRVQVQNLVNSLTTGLSVAVFDRILNGLAAIAAGFKNLIDRGVEFNATVQDARLGIAAVIKQFDDTGAIKNFDDAIKVADDALNQLKIEARQSPATLQQLIQAFQGVSGAALGAGISVKDTVSLVTLMSQALAGLGIRSDQILQESRALLTGNITEDAAAAKILGITKAQIDQAKQQGQLYDFLTQKLSAFSEAASRGSRNYTTALANLQDALDAVAGEATEKFFEALTQAILDLSAAFQDPGFQDGLEPFIEDLTTLTTKTAEFSVKAIAAVEHIGRLYEFMRPEQRPERNGIFENVFGRIIEDNPLAVVSRAAGRYTAFWEEYYKPKSKSAKDGAPEAIKETAAAAGNAIPVIESLTSAQKKLVEAISSEFDKLGVDQAGQQLLDYMEKSKQLQEAFKPPAGKEQSETEKAAYQKAQSELEEIYLARIRATREAENERRSSELEAEEEFLDQLRADALSYGDDKAAIVEAETELLKQHIRERITDAEKLQEALAIADQIRIERLKEETAQIYELSAAYSRFANETKSRLEELQSTWSDVGTAISDVAIGGIQSAVRGVGDTIGDAIYTTGNWERTFARVSQSIVRSLINVVVEYVAQMTLVRGLRRIMDAEQVASAGVRTAAEAPAATAASIGSFGAAATIGVAALLAGLAVGVAAFETGGKVKGGRQLIQVNESGEEFVMNARATATLGDAFLSNLQAAAEAGVGMESVMRTVPVQRGAVQQSSSTPQPVNVNPAPVYILKVHDNDAVLETLRSREGRKELYTLTKEQAIELGLDT